MLSKYVLPWKIFADEKEMRQAGRQGTPRHKCWAYTKRVLAASSSVRPQPGLRYHRNWKWRQWLNRHLGDVKKKCAEKIVAVAHKSLTGKFPEMMSVKWRPCPSCCDWFLAHNYELISEPRRDASGRYWEVTLHHL
jgi:hypothetical protein